MSSSQLKKMNLFILSLLVFVVGHTSCEKTHLWLPDDHDGTLHYVEFGRKDVKPLDVNEEDLRFTLYTRDSPNEGLTGGLRDFELIQNSAFDASKQTMLMFHGWLSNPGSDFNMVMKDALLTTTNVWNVMCMDWSVPAGQDYELAVATLPEVSPIMGTFITNLGINLGLSIENVAIAGHSLGGQLVGFIGAALNGNVPIIIASDPAGPGFNASLFDLCLDPSDGRYVQVIHTGAIIMGHADPLGHLDLYPNGGDRQPACGEDTWGTCSHSMAYKYFAESLRAGGFTATGCESWDDFLGDLCADGPKSKLGGLDFQLDTQSSGTYYLETNNEPPYSID